MKQQWFEALSRLGHVGKGLEEKVPPIIASGTLTKDQAQTLWDRLGEFADECQRLHDLMDNFGSEETPLEAADSLAFLSTANSLRDRFLKLQEAVGPELIMRGAWPTHAVKAR
jgi:hypothetical protein